MFDYRTYNLKEHFDEFNRQFWNGELPNCPLRWIKDRKKMVAGAFAQFDSDGPGSHCWRIKILVPIATDERHANALLLHEMIHLQLKDDPTEWKDHPDFHGEKFNSKATELEQMTGYADIKARGMPSWDREVRALACTPEENTSPG